MTRRRDDSPRDLAQLAVPTKLALVAWMAVLACVFVLVALPADSPLASAMPTVVLKARALALSLFRADTAVQ